MLLLTALGFFIDEWSGYYLAIFPFLILKFIYLLVIISLKEPGVPNHGQHEV